MNIEFNDKENFKKKYYIPATHFLLLNKLLTDVIKVINGADKMYWIDGGTLLGAVRHKGQIPWDDDVDIGVKEEDYQYIMRLLKKKLHDKYKFEAYHNLFKVFVPGKWVVVDDNRLIGTPTLDIFPWKENYENKTYDIVYPHNELWPDCKHQKSDMFPLKKYEFNKKMVYGPQNPFPYLNKMYPDWNKKAIIEIRKLENINKCEKVEIEMIQE